MKEVWYFIKWQVGRSTKTLADKLWLLGAFFIGSGAYSMFAYPKEGTPWQMYAGLGCWMLVLLKWMTWDAVQYQWGVYKREKAQLLETIKDGK